MNETIDPILEESSEKEEHKKKKKEEKDQKRRRKPKMWLIRIQYFALTVSLFLDDFRLLFIKNEYDFYIDLVMGLLFLFFGAEIFFRIFFQGKKYFFSMLFILDIFAAVSILFDMILVYDNFLFNLQKYFFFKEI